MSVVGKSLGAGAEHQARLPQHQHERNAPVCERHGNDLLPVPVPVHLWRRDVLRTFAGTQGACSGPKAGRPRGEKKRRHEAIRHSQRDRQPSY